MHPFNLICFSRDLFYVHVCKSICTIHKDPLLNSCSQQIKQKITYKLQIGPTHLVLAQMSRKLAWHHDQIPFEAKLKSLMSIVSVWYQTKPDELAHYVHSSLWYWLNSGNEGSLSSALLNSMLSFYEGSISTHIAAHPDQFPSPWKIWLSWLWLAMYSYIFVPWLGESNV